MKCEDFKPNLFSYFFEAKIHTQRCNREAEWIVSVNPPEEGNDGKVRLCEICNSSSYIGFSRERL